MKRTAFIQALVLVVLLISSWLFLWHRMRWEPQEAQTGPAVESAPDLTEEPAEADVTSTSGPEEYQEEILPSEPVPDDWQEWWDYLAGQSSPAAMREALQQLENLVFSLPPEQAQRWLLSFIQSSQDMRTGLAFQIGRNGSLTGASSLKAILLDWLSRLNPGLAAELARNDIENMGTRLVPDVFVIHMRNFARGATISEEETNLFLKEHFAELLNHDPWLERPVSAVAEAMDIAVYTGFTESVPELVQLMESNRPQMLRHASAIAIERLVDRYPFETLPHLLDSMDQPVLGKARAGYFARLRPDSPSARSLLQDYLTAPQVSEMEGEWFLRSFPNLNQSFSHNLLSRNISITESGNHLDWLREAMESVTRWQQDPGLSRYDEILRETAQRLQAQIYGTP